MATRTAQIIIQVDDKSLIALNNEIKAMETSMKGLKIGTTEWVAQNQKLGDLKNKFKDATDEAKKLQNVVQKVSGDQQLKAIVKLGQGMVGAFAAVNGAVTLLGGSSETFDKITAKAASFLAVMQGLNAISELFSATNMKGLKAVGVGFGQLVTTVKASSLAMKTALISTGVGALVVGIGLLISNWEKIKDLITGTSKKEEEANENSRKFNEESAKNLQNLNKFYSERLNLIKEINFALGTDALTTEQTAKLTEDSIKTQIEEYKKLIAVKQLSIEDPKKKKENLSLDKEILVNQEKINRLKNNTDNLSVSIVKQARTELQLAQEKRILNNESTIADNVELVLLRQKLVYFEKFVAERLRYNESEKLAIKAREDEIKGIEIQLLKLTGKKDVENEIYNLKKKAIDEELDGYAMLGLSVSSFTEQEKERIINLQAQLVVLKTENDLYNYQVEISKTKYEQDLKDLKVQHELSAAISELEFKYQSINEINKEISDQIKNATDAIDNQLIVEKNAEEHRQNVLEINKIIDENHKIGWKERIDALQTELDYFILIQEKTKEKLELEKLGLENQKKSNDNNILKLQEEKDNILKDQEENDATAIRLKNELDSVKNDKFLSIEEKQQKTLDLQSKINETEVKSLENKTQIANANNEIVNSNNENLKLNNQIDKVSISINKTVTDTADKTAETTAEIEKQSRGYEKLQGFIANYGEEIDIIMQGLGQSMELIASIFDAESEKQQTKIDKLNAEYEEMNSVEADRQDRLLEYETELKDANGERYDELLGLIQEEKDAKDAAYISEELQRANIKKLEDEKMIKERKAAQWRKAAAIVEGVVQGALAVIKALPNVFLAVATGVAAAASIATIAVQKVPDKPYAKGGIIEGARHSQGGVKIEAEGGEFIVNRNSTAKYLPLLRRVNDEGNRKYENGGYVSPVQSINTSGMIDYDKLSQALILGMSALPSPQVSLVNISNGLHDVELTKQNASITR